MTIIEFIVKNRHFKNYEDQKCYQNYELIQKKYYEYMNLMKFYEKLEIIYLLMNLKINES